MIRSFFGLIILAAALSSGAELATATISGTPVGPGEFQYNLNLMDTGPTTIGTFWFAWVPGDNFMAVSPTGIVSPTGWQDLITSGGPSNGFAIQWTAIAPANDLTPGNSLAFSFDSSLTLAQLQGFSSGTPGTPVDTAFIYVGAPLTDAGFEVNTSAVPEPATLWICALGLGALVVGLRKG